MSPLKGKVISVKSEPHFERNILKTVTDVDDICKIVLNEKKKKT